MLLSNGLASTLDSLAAWWRGRGVRTVPAPVPARKSTRPAVAPAPAHEDKLSPTHADEALRRFMALALDDPRAKLPRDEELAKLQPLIAAASAALSKLEVQAKYLPRRPSLLPKLLSAMNSDANSMRELATIIGGDPTLLGNLLRVANSVFYRNTEKPVESLERAVTLVGTDGIRSVIATSLIHPVMATGTGWFAKFPEIIWEQTQYAADAAEAHALQVERVDGFSARLLALLYGLSINTVFRIVRDEVLVGRDASAKPAVAQLLDRWVLPTAQRIAGNWDLPQELQTMLAWPHEQTPLGRSLFFGRLAGAQIVMVRHGLIKEASARATLLAADTRRVQIDRLWARLAAACQTRG
jgi:HD-like signal output (HDOD) protein